MAAGLGLFAGAVVAVVLGVTPVSIAFPRLMIALAGLVLIPPLDDIVRNSGDSWVPGARWRFGSAVLLAAGLVLPAGITSTVLVFPWAALLCAVALREFDMLAGALRSGDLPRRICAWRIVRTAGLVFPSVGAAWLMLAAMGYRPLGFASDIVILTAMHFHFAGAILPLLVSEAARRRPGRLADFACAGVVIGVPLVAVGITATQMRGPQWIEWIAASWMAAAGSIAAMLILRARPQKSGTTSDVLRLISGGSLATGMMFAGLYGLRSLLGIEDLTIPAMQASHGVVMAFGFAGCGVVAEWLGARRQVLRRRQSPRTQSGGFGR